jgi:putative inorganic carbon (HCO3(-)) transporter
VIGLKATASWIAGLEPGVVALAAPFLLFPTVLPAGTAFALLALLVVWLARWIGMGRPGAHSPFDIALLLLVLMVPIAVWASTIPELTIPKLAGLVLGLAAFRALVNAANTSRRLWAASLVFLTLGFVLVLVGLIGADWHAKWPALDPILTRVPRLLQGLPGAEGGINLNELAGALLLFLPISLALVVAPHLRRSRPSPPVRVAALLLTLVSAAALFLTQSRSAWTGILVAVVVMAWLRWPRFRWEMAAGLLALVAVLLYAGPQTTVESISASPGPQESDDFIGMESLVERGAIWDRALSMVQDFPLTGTGLGTFRRLVYVLNPVAEPNHTADIGHAHNVFLQVALDLGLPGLVAYLALVGIALWIGWRAAWMPGPQEVETPQASASGEKAPVMAGEFRWLGIGIVGSLVAFHVYGLTDAIALGAKPGVAFWMILALSAALLRSSPESVRSSACAAESPPAAGA